MSDLPEALAARIARALDACLLACGRHQDLLATQRAALRTDDSALLASLADESAELIASVERQTRFPVEIRRMVLESSGPLATLARQQLEQIRRQAASAQAGIQELTATLVARKIGLLRELGSLTSAGPRTLTLPPATLDVTG